MPNKKVEPQDIRTWFGYTNEVPSWELEKVLVEILNGEYTFEQMASDFSAIRKESE